MSQLTKILAISIMVFIPISSHSHDGEKHSLIGESKADKLDQCVEPTEVMQKEHFEFLYHQRENTVEKGIRTKNHSLANCIDCHVSHDEKGKPIPVNAEGQFCQTCHVKTAVNIDCFSCHATVPRDNSSKIKSTGYNQNIHIESTANNLVEYYKETNYEK